MKIKNHLDGRLHRDEGRMPRDERGWRVAPAPDGRGLPDPPPARPPHRSRGFLWFVVLLLVLNFGSVLLVRPSAQPRVTVPFSPYFVSAVQAGRVATISSTGDTIKAHSRRRSSSRRETVRPLARPCSARRFRPFGMTTS